MYGGAVLRFALKHTPIAVQPLLGPSHYVRQTKDHHKVIVFVHGVTGTATETWTRTSTGTPSAYWPSIVEKDDRLRDYDIFVVSYYSPQLDNGPNIFQLADALTKDLEEHSIYPNQNGHGQYTEIVFICHSMGNLIVRTSMIVKPLPKHSIAQIRLILSIASPSEGTERTELVERISANPAFKEMDKIESNSFLQLLNKLWAKQAFDTEIACAFELRNYPGLIKPIVDKDSATAVCTRPDPQGIDEDHINIVKPTDRNHPTHRWMVAEVEKPVAKMGWELDRWAKNEIIVGGKDYMESNIHAAMMALVIEANVPELKVTRRYSFGHASRLHSALKDRVIDIYPEYDGSLLYEYLGKELTAELNKADTDAVNRELEKTDQTQDMRYFPHFGFDNPYVLVMLRSQAQRLGLVKDDGTVMMTDVANQLRGRLVILGDQEFSFRKEWIALKKSYDLQYKDYQFARHSEIYDRLRQGAGSSCANSESPNLSGISEIVGVGFGTDLEVNRNTEEFVVITDDKRSLPTYHPAPLVNQLLLRKFPAIERALESLAGIMMRRDMSELLESASLADVRSNTPSDKEKALELVVRRFLVGKGILVSG
jgi:glycine betaine/choline ABC-type transport system substrate-binding protein